MLLPVFILPARRVGRAAGRDHPRVVPPRREDERHDDRAVRRRRRAAGQAVRPARRPRRRGSPTGPRGSATSASSRRCTRAPSSSRCCWSPRWRRRSPTAWAAGSRSTARVTAGTVVTLALLLTRLYGPLTALSNVRVDVMSALVSFDRVFEVLDLRAGHRREARRGRRCPAGAGRRRVPRRALPLPDARPRSRSPRWRTWRRSTAPSPSRCCAGVVVHRRARADGRAGRPVRRRQVDHRRCWCRRVYDVTDGAVLVGGVDVRDATLDSLRDTIGVVTQDSHLFHETIAENLRYARPDATDDELWAALRGAQIADLVRGAARRARHGGRRARLPLLRRREAAHRDRPAAAQGAVDRHPRRGHRAPRLRVRGGGAAGAVGGAGRPHRAGHRAPAVHRPRRRPDPGARRGPDRRARHARASWSPPAGSTPSCTAPSSRSPTRPRRSPTTSAPADRWSWCHRPDYPVPQGRGAVGPATSPRPSSARLSPVRRVRRPAQLGEARPPACPMRDSGRSGRSGWAAPTVACRPSVSGLRADAARGAGRSRSGTRSRPPRPASAAATGATLAASDLRRRRPARPGSARRRGRWRAPTTLVMPSPSAEQLAPARPGAAGAG